MAEMDVEIDRISTLCGRLRDALAEHVTWSEPVQLYPGNGREWADRQGCDLCGVRAEPGVPLVHKPECLLWEEASNE